jgi:hypothetical protein
VEPHGLNNVFGQSMPGESRSQTLCLAEQAIPEKSRKLLPRRRVAA